MSHLYRNHIIQNIKTKPILHKKGKQWIVISLSALVLGLGISAADLTTHADVTVPKINTSRLQRSGYSSKNDYLSDIQHKADNLHKNIVNNAENRNKQNQPAEMNTNMPQTGGTSIQQQDKNDYQNAVNEINQKFIYNRTLDTRHTNGKMSYYFYNPAYSPAIGNTTGGPTVYIYGNKGDEVFLHHEDNRAHKNNAVYVSDYVYDKNVYDRDSLMMSPGANQYMQSDNSGNSDSGQFFILPSDQTEFKMIRQNGAGNRISQQPDGSIGTLGFGDNGLNVGSFTPFFLKKYDLIGNNFVDANGRPVSDAIHHFQIVPDSDLSLQASGPVLDVNSSNASEYGFDSNSGYQLADDNNYLRSADSTVGYSQAQSYSPYNLAYVFHIPVKMIEATDNVFYTDPYGNFIKLPSGYYSYWNATGKKNSTMTLTNAEVHQQTPGCNILQSDWQIATPNEQYTFTLNGQQVSIPVKPVQRTDTVDFIDGGQVVGYENFTGNDYRTNINGYFNLTNSALPSEYRLSKTYTLPYSGQTLYIPVNRAAADRINYICSDDGVGTYNVGHTVFNGLSDETDTPLKSFYNDLADKQTSQLPDFPKGYSVAPDAFSSFESQYIDALQNSNGRNYSNKVINVPVIVTPSDNSYADSLNANDEKYSEALSNHAKKAASASASSFNKYKSEEANGANKADQYVIDTINFKHGSRVIKTESKPGQKGAMLNVSADVPAGYNVNSGTDFSYDGQIHDVQLGVSEPNDNSVISMPADTIKFVYNNQDIKSVQKQGQEFTPVDYNGDIPSGYKALPTSVITYDGQSHTVDLNKIDNDTVQFKHGDDIVKTEHKTGLNGDDFNVSADVPSQYNVNSGVQFKYNGGTHVVELGVSRPNKNSVITPHVNPAPRPNKNSTVKMKTDTFDFNHGSKVVSSIQMAGQNGASIDVSNYVPSQYNEHTNTSFTFDGHTHVVQLGISRPNKNSDITPKLNPAPRPNGNKTINLKTDTFNFDHGSQVISSIQLAGENGASVNVNSYVPAQYNKHTNTSFVFDGHTHVVQLGVSRPNKNSDITPRLNPAPRPNGNETVKMKTDTFNFKHGSKLIKTLQLTGESGSRINVSDDKPSQYNVADNTVFAFDGQVHDIQLGVSRPNKNSDVSPRMIHDRPNGNQNIAMKTDTFDFNHGDKVVKSVQLGGEKGSLIDVRDYVPSQYNVHTGTVFTFNGKTHVIELGVSRPIPNNSHDRHYQWPKPKYNDDVTLVFTNDNRVVKTVKVQGGYQALADYMNDIPKGYQVNNKPQVKYDGKTHVIEIIKSAPNPQPSHHNSQPSGPVNPQPQPNNNNNNSGGDTPVPLPNITPVIPNNQPDNKPVINNYVINNNYYPTKPSDHHQSYRKGGNNYYITNNYYNTPRRHAQHRHIQRRYTPRRIVKRGDIVMHRVNDLTKIKLGQTVRYHGLKITRMRMPSYFRWFYILKTCLAHNDLYSIGHSKNYRYVLRPHHDITLRINRFFRVQRKHDVIYDYEVRIHGHNYFVTHNVHFTRNAYYQPHDLRKVHGIFRYHFEGRLIQRAGLYSRRHYSKRTFIRSLRKGKKVRIRRVVPIGRHGDDQTRFQLTNGDYITSNKNWIVLI